MRRSWRFAPMPRGWYFACPSGAVAMGASVVATVAGLPISIGRDPDRSVRASLACDARARLGAVERYGGVFVIPSAGAPAPFPELRAGARVISRVGRAVRLDCHWAAVVANGFDVQHLGVVHRRSLVGPPRVERIGQDRFRLEYESTVTGRTTADRVMGLISGGTIRASIECWSGTAIVVESSIGRLRASLLLCLAPDDTGVTVRPIVAVPEGHGDALRALAAGWLYGAFLASDVALLEGMRFRPAPVLPEDAVLAACLEYLSALPGIGEHASDVASDEEDRGLDVAEALAARGTFEQQRA